MTRRDHGWHVSRAQRLLGELGIEIAGLEITTFVVRLLQGQDAGIADGPNVEAAIDEVADGPLGLVAGEPALGGLDVGTPVRSVHQAADAAVRLFAGRVLERQRADPVVPPAPPGREEMARMRERWRTGRPDRDPPAQVPVELLRLASPRWSERLHAAQVLGRLAVQEARPRLARLLDDPYPEVAEAAATALRAIPPAGPDDVPAPDPVALPDFGERYAAMDAQDAARYVETHFEPLWVDLQTWEARYRDPDDGSTWIVDHPDAARPGGRRAAGPSGAGEDGAVSAGRDRRSRAREPHVGAHHPRPRRRRRTTSATDFRR